MKNKQNKPDKFKLWSKPEQKWIYLNKKDYAELKKLWDYWKRFYSIKKDTKDKI